MAHGPTHPRPDLDPVPSHPHRVDATCGPWIALVGAGPGDPELLTRRGSTLLGAADVVLHDWLAGAAVLELVRPDCRVVDVGKGKGCGTAQPEIERLLLAHHSAGARVVRLKGGDPFLFGRGMEEVRAAGAAGIAVEVVPGISSALAAPALGGVAVTDRGVSAHVTVLSGHRAADAGANDWAALARLGGTLVVLMAASTGPSVARALRCAGMDGATPVAVVVDASGPRQAVLRLDLAELAGRRRPLPGPCVLVIGPVAAGAGALAAAGVVADLAPV